MKEEIEFKPTEELTPEQYPTKTPYNKKEDILKLVNFEDRINIKTFSIPLPKHIQSKVVPLTAGVFNMCRQFLP